MPNPLHKKLDIKAGEYICVLNQPKNYLDFFLDFPPDVVINFACETQDLSFVHIFVTTVEELGHYFPIAKKHLSKSGMLWISWPKKTSKTPTEVDKFTIMKYGLDHGLVDTKVVSIDEDWSAYKFMYRTRDR